VTGCAGFIGSSTALELLRSGHRVRGVDRMSNYYDTRLKRRNLIALQQYPEFDFVEGDLADLDIRPLLDGVEYVMHFAAQAGVRSSWGSEFGVYVRDNVLSTQRLLEAATGARIKKLLYASSSSVYGNAPECPTTEQSPTRPMSPYGVTKLAGENLALLYQQNYRVPVVCLRYFTVYGPRQRPDMAFHKFVRAALTRVPILVFGDGSQTRDFTYVEDVVMANTAATMSENTIGVFNIGGGHQLKLNDVLDTLSEVLGCHVEREIDSEQPGDVHDTSADISKAQRAFGYEPRTGLEEGLRSEVDWVTELMQEGL
jgi:nucleoside-diphosphate-sugar epimerase